MEDKAVKKKSSKKASRKSSVKDDESANGSQQEKPKAKAAPSPRPTQPPANAPPPSMMQHMNLTNPAMGGLRPGMEAGLRGGGLDMAAYQNMMRDRQIAAQMGLTPGLGGPIGGGLGMMDRSFMGGPSGLLSSGLGGGSPGMLPASGGYAGLDMSSTLTPEEQLYLLRRNQEDTDMSIRRRLELLQQQRARQMQLLEMQAPLPASNMGMMQERQLLMKRQRMEQLLAAQGGAPRGPPPAGY